MFTVKSVFSGHSKIDKMKVLKTGGSLMQVKVLQNAPLEHFAILLTCIKRLPVLKTYFLSSFEWLIKKGLTVVVRHFHLLSL